jgi:hypothetical protein
MPHVSRASLSLMSSVICLSIFLITMTPSSVEPSTIGNITGMNGSVWFAGEQVGSIRADLDDIEGPGSVVKIMANITKDPNPGKVYEGWLHDPKVFSTFDLSLGIFNNNTLRFQQFMNNPDIYKYFVVSEEPVGPQMFILKRMIDIDS